MSAKWHDSVSEQKVISTSYNDAESSRRDEASQRRRSAGGNEGVSARFSLLTDLPREAFGGSAGATNGKRAERLSGVRCMGDKNLVVDGRVHERRGLSGALYRLLPDGLMKGTMRVTCGCCTPNATTVCIWPDRPCARWVFAEAGVLLVQRAGRVVKSRYIHSTVQDLQGGCVYGRPLQAHPSQYEHPNANCRVCGLGKKARRA
ncbi:hypothetical protein BDY17DRAFT_109918 [Neohortaea acidophila]|uniref:Uncharacterized protein n=1 Tax=Neohortaea acidophila TaxID=245834 RepID=A0A6A6Q088_9PEZI|nr:uncharacterized protein BDY17DRAFT_109918 [Neohortaea acidophila]KAF2485675.1 hypothetical protein BDY17DRAFT_109918 [Neohortaea acidophila]